MSLSQTSCKFFVGQVVHHRLFNYRGVIVDVDGEFQGTQDWYNQVASSRPPKNKPWYHVLVHRGEHMTYVAERNLEADDSEAAVDHPMLTHFFTRFKDGKYLRLMS